MDDIVERLRHSNDRLLMCGQDYSDVVLDAAIEIERLREALEKIAERDLQSIAKQALLEIQKYDNQAIAIDALAPNSRVALEEGA